jgi:hypothetical protein
VVLLLASELQQLPWESLPMLEEYDVCRMPSLFFLRAALSCASANASTEWTAREADFSQARYVINPSGDLAATQERLAPVMSGIWGADRGIVGRAPSAIEYKQVSRGAPPFPCLSCSL